MSWTLATLQKDRGLHLRRTALTMVRARIGVFVPVNSVDHYLAAYINSRNNIFVNTNNVCKEITM